MKPMTNPGKQFPYRRKITTVGWPLKAALACLCLIFFLSLDPLKADARKNDRDSSDPVITEHQDSSNPEDTNTETEYTGKDPDPSADPLNPENPDNPEDPVQPVNPIKPENPSVPVYPPYPVDPADGTTDKDKLVTYTAATVSKGGYSTPIWKQHAIWKKRSSASRHGCGICVTSMALQLSGVPSNPNMVLKQTNRSMKRCKSLKPNQAVKVLKKNHVNVRPVNTRAFSRKQCVDIMKEALDNGKVIMTLVRGKPFSNNTHWVLIVGYDQKGRIVVANSSYGNRNYCKKTRKQYHLVNWKQIQKKIIRDSANYSAFIIVG